VVRWWGKVEIVCLMETRRKEMWELRCQSCGKTFLMDRKKYFRRREGWRTYYYCSKECLTFKGRIGNFAPMDHQSEADRKKVLDEVVNKLVKRKS
jgi:hypothetical protein